MPSAALIAASPLAGRVRIRPLIIVCIAALVAAAALTRRIGVRALIVIGDAVLVSASAALSGRVRIRTLVIIRVAVLIAAPATTGVQLPMIKAASTRRRSAISISLISGVSTEIPAAPATSAGGPIA